MQRHLCRGLAALIAGALLHPALSHAHDAWGAPVPVYQINHKHLDGPGEDFPRHRLMSLQLLDDSGASVDYRLLDGPDGALAYADAPAARLHVVIDNGLWTQSPVHGYRRGAGKAFVADQTVRNFMKYGKSELRWTADATAPVGHRLELIATEQPKVGEAITVLVHFNGAALPNAEVTSGAGDAEQRFRADAKGRVQLPIDALPAQFAVRHEAPSPEPGVDSLNMAATLYLGRQSNSD